jgi:hypothetical protein
MVILEIDIARVFARTAELTVSLNVALFNPASIPETV